MVLRNLRVACQKRRQRPSTTGFHRPLSSNRSGARVINYPGNFLLPDGYPGIEYSICHIYLIGFSSIILNKFLLLIVAKRLNWSSSLNFWYGPYGGNPWPTPHCVRLAPNPCNLGVLVGERVLWTCLFSEIFAMPIHGVARKLLAVSKRSWCPDLW